MPVLNEMSSMPCLLPYLESLDVDELVIVDGGSHDGSPQALKAAGIHVLNSEPGRASQMNLGAEVLKSDYVIFLHADTRLPINFHSEIRDLWGRFDVRFDSELLSMGVIAWFMNMRSRFTISPPEIKRYLYGVNYLSLSVVLRSWQLWKTSILAARSPSTLSRMLVVPRSRQVQGVGSRTV